MRIVCQRTILMKYYALNCHLLQIIGGVLWVKKWKTPEIACCLSLIYCQLGRNHLDLLIMCLSMKFSQTSDWEGVKSVTFRLPLRRAAYSGSHRLEKYFNKQDCLEKSLKIKFALKSTWKALKGLEKSLNFTICKRIQHCFFRPKSV